MAEPQPASCPPTPGPATPPATLPPVAPCECEVVRLGVASRGRILLYGCLGAGGCGRVFFLWWPGLEWWADAAVMVATVQVLLPPQPPEPTPASRLPAAPPYPFRRCPNCGKSEGGHGLFERVWEQVGREWQCAQVCQKCNRAVAVWSEETGWLPDARWVGERWAMSAAHARRYGPQTTDAGSPAAHPRTMARGGASRCCP